MLVGSKSVHHYYIGRISNQRDSGSQAHMVSLGDVGGYDKIWVRCAFEMPVSMSAQPSAISFKAKMIANLYEERV